MLLSTRRALAEAIGTGGLVATVVGSGIMATRLTQDVALQLLINALATVAVLAVLIWAVGPISGAHFNPVVTLVAVVRREMPATPAQEPPQRPANPLPALGIEAPPKRPQNAAETPAQLIETAPATEAPAWRVALDALHESAPDLATYCNAVEALTLPGDAAPVWRSHRAAIGAMSKETKGSAWGALVARVESLGQRNAAAWITKGVKTLDAQTDAPAATEVTP